ncbi:hypothetical protein BD324DRAFT_648848 [Kockovaella imperatae]|uniref:Ricin B lectin domain-containing protein n=1 Tax=Kockovaella imperatae TaxID=4999 RepID=A0A1Y1UQJ1_9TREE|nr:hypothetical protein BD324DRAFT_648848 [Kockovaella imperatae]ORX40259.1 hypothetical protein BD324DRAFT_648848 [Kockovaella imperatae]
MYKLFAALAAIAPLASAAPALNWVKRSESLSCVQYQYTPPFDSPGLNGFIHLYSNVTQSDGSFSETRLGINANGELQPCGECQSTQQFGFEVCQGSESRKGYNGLGNSAGSFYGHILFTNNQATIQCLKAERNPVNRSTIIVADCEYDYDNVMNSDQYWEVASGRVTRLRASDGSYYGGSYGINPDVQQDQPIQIFDGPATGPFTYLGWKAPTF